MTAREVAISKRLDEGAVLGSIQNLCPEGTKAWMLCLGYLECDDGFVVRGGNTSLMSTKGQSFVNKRRVLPMYCVLIEHPHEGLILWETGSGKDYPEVWGPQLADIFSRTRYEPEHELEAAIASTGHSYKDIKAIVIGHLHLDHAGGLDLFKELKDIPIWVHERELKGAFYSVATGADAGVYLDHYLDTKLNWKTFDDTTLDFAQGIVLHHVPGHTDGSVCMQLNLINEGTFIFTGDLFHVKENYTVVGLLAITPPGSTRTTGSSASPLARRAWSSWDTTKTLATSMADESFLVPDSYESSSQYHFSQTQTQTQTQTQPLSQPAGDYFPSNLWGLLVSTSATPTDAELARREKENQPNAADEEYVERPGRVEMAWGTTECKIGRHPKADVVLNGKKISSWHARIFLDPDGDDSVRLEDTSTNGTFVRGQKVGKDKVTLLEPGDEIIFGAATTSFLNDFRYIFQGPHGPKAAKRAPWGIAESSGGGIHEKYDVWDQIGKGSFATVRKGIQRSTGKIMAIKIIQKARFAANPKTMEMISREVEIMKALDHKYCVRYVDYFEDEQRMWLVMEYVDGGDLLDYVMKRKGLTENETRDIALMVCEAVAYLHSKGVAHRDLKPENLLLTRGVRPIAKVTDFGLAKMVDTNTMLRTACGTPSYLAPEVILKEAHAGYGSAVDAWSIGVVLYSCMTNSTPFDESESTPLPQRMAERRVDFNGLEGFGISDIAIDFLRKLLVTNPAERMSVKDSLSHPWLLKTPTVAGATKSLPLHVSTLPYNGGADDSRPSSHSVPFGANTPSITSANVSGDDSFVYSQQLDNLRLDTPARSMASPSLTTPDRIMDDPEHDPSTDAGDTTVGPMTPVVGLGSDTTIQIGSPIPTSLKRKEPASAFSSASDVDGEDVAGSAMSLDLEPMRMVMQPPKAIPEEKEEEEVVAKPTEELAPEEEVASVENAARGTRRRSVAAKPAPTSRRRTGGRRATSEPVDLATLETGLPGPTTRRRAKVARLS